MGVVSFLLISFGGVYAARESVLPPAARVLNTGHRPAAVDYVMVLGGGSDTRPFAAAAMYNAGLAKTVLVAISKPSPETEDGLLPTHDEIIRRVLLLKGVPDDAVLRIGPECVSTHDEARALSDFLLDHPGATVAVVTHNYHTRRTARVFRRLLGPLASQVSFIGIPTETFQEDNWWKSRDGFLTYLNEYCKTVYYLAKY